MNTGRYDGGPHLSTNLTDLLRHFMLFLQIPKFSVSFLVISKLIHFLIILFLKCILVVFCFSPGGLVTAVAPVVVRGKGFWVGWPGIHLDDPNEPIPESDPADRTPTAGLLSEKVNLNMNFLNL